MAKKSVKERFLEKVNWTGTCWLWTASKNSDGYGHFRFEGVSNYAHRVSWLLFNGPLEHGAVVRHNCDNPTCVNPDHLLVGSHIDNVKDRVRRNRSATKESNGRTKLTQKIVEECRASNKSSKFLAKKYGVNDSTMRRARQRLTWNT